MEIHRLRHVPLADHHGAGSPHAAHDLGVVAIDESAAARDAEGRREPADGEAFLDADRHPGQKPSFRPSGDRVVQRLRVGLSLAPPLLDQGVEGGSDVVVPPPGLGDHIDRRPSPCGHRLGDVARRGRP